MLHVSNDDRISAALIRLEQIERLVLEARKIFSYAEKQEIGGNNDSVYPGQLNCSTTIETEEIDECET